MIIIHLFVYNPFCVLPLNLTKNLYDALLIDVSDKCQDAPTYIDLSLILY